MRVCPWADWAQQFPGASALSPAEMANMEHSFASAGPSSTQQYGELSSLERAK